MNKRQWFPGLATLLLAAATIGGTLALHALPTRSTSTDGCDPKHLPTPVSASEKNIPPAIKPHLCSVPTFTQQDVRHYMSTISRFEGLRIEQISRHFTVTRVLFVTNKVANDTLNADTGLTDDSLIVCYVEVSGDFTVAAPFASKNSKPAIFHHGEMVFDGITGGLLAMGVKP